MSERYPALSAELAQQLSNVPITDNLYRPCKVILDDGSARDRVYVVEAEPWFRFWGVWPEDDSGKSLLPVQRVKKIINSPSRLPASAANKLYAAGESGMGYTIFTVSFRDGTSLVIGTGNAIDFVDYPSGQSEDTVLDVFPHIGRGDPTLKSGPEYAWCLYSSYEANQHVR